MTTNTILLGFLGIGSQEIIIILIIVLILFGGSRIPQLMRGLGKGINEYKKAKAGLYDEENTEASEKKDKEKNAREE